MLDHDERAVTVDWLYRLIQDGQAPPVIDVRSGFEYRRGHVPGAVHLPFWKAWRGLPEGALPDDQDAAAAEPVLYCGRGPRAVVAAWLLRRRLASGALLLRGHMREWMRAGYPRER